MEITTFDIRKLSNELRNRKIPLDAMLKVPSSYLISLFLYGSEYCEISLQKNRFKTTVIRFYRGILRIESAQHEETGSFKENGNKQGASLSNHKKESLTFRGTY